MFIEVKAGQQFRYNDRVIEVDGAVGPATISARDVLSGELLTAPIAKLAPLQTPDSSKRRLDVISELDWERAKWVRNLLGPYIERRSVPQKIMSEIALKCEVSERTVRRWLRKLRGTPVPSALVPKRVGRKKGGWSVGKKAEEVVSHCIDKYHLRREHCTLSETLERIEKLCRRLGIKAPSWGVLERRVKSLNGFESLSRRRGLKAAKQRHEPRTGSANVSTPLQMVQVDHTKVDGHVVSADRWRVWLGRPWLTIAIDVYTRCVLGIYLSLDAPSSLAIGMCMSHVILPKEPWLEALGIQAPWPMYGRPEMLHVDNAMEFRGSAAERGCEEFQITIQHRPVGAPHWGGHIERLIGRMMGRVHFLPGTTFSSVRDRQDYESEKRACMTLTEMQEWLVYEICCNYHVKQHRGTGRLPVHAWNDAFKTLN
jgi:putative transposase